MGSEAFDGLLVLAPMGMLLLGGLATMVLDAFGGARSGVAFAAAASLFAAAAVAVGGALGPSVEAPAWVGAHVATDAMAWLFDALLCLGGGVAALLSGAYLREHGQERGEFYVLMVFGVLGAVVLARAVDLLTLFLGLETMSLAVYALVAFRRTSLRATEGALKYFLLGSFAAAVLLFGSALLYGATGHIDFRGIAEVIEGGRAEPRLTLLALAMLLVGLAFKLGAVPFHAWAPDAYQGAMTPVTAFMAVAVKAAAFAVTLRVLVGVFGDELSRSAATGWPSVVAALAAVSMVVGNLAAIAQRNIKRMLAYSSIAHAGYALVGLAAAVRVGEQAVGSVVYYTMAYTAGSLLAFGALVAFGSRGRDVTDYEDLAGAGRRHPALALAFTLGIVSLLGLPPTAGFFGKYHVFQAAIRAGGGLVTLAVLGVIMSAVGAYYYLRVLVFLFMKEPQEGAPIAVPMRSGYVVAALLLAGWGVIELGLFPHSYLQVASRAAAALVGG